MMNHIDIFAHILPPNFLKAMLQIAPNALDGSNSWMQHPLLTDLEKHVASLPVDEQQVLSAVNLNPENFLDPEDDRIVALNHSGNDEMARIVKENPTQFLAAVAMVPMNRVSDALNLIDEQVAGPGGMAGIQLFTRAMGRSIADPSFDAIFEKMAQIRKPIWLHPVFDERRSDNNLTYSWEYELTMAMDGLVANGVFKRYPNLKIIVHHAGAMVPFFSERIKYIQGEEAYKDYQKFYVDTAILGNPSAIKLASDFFGVSHVLYGTDAPLGIPPIGAAKVIRKAIEQSGLSKTEQEEVFRLNSQRLLKF